VGHAAAERPCSTLEPLALFPLCLQVTSIGVLCRMGERWVGFILGGATATPALQPRSRLHLASLHRSRAHASGPPHSSARIKGRAAPFGAEARGACALMHARGTRGSATLKQQPADSYAPCPAAACPPLRTYCYLSACPYSPAPFYTTSCQPSGR
jgi:hypothetical protein